MRDCSHLHGHEKPHRQPHPLTRFFPFIDAFATHRPRAYATDILAGAIISVVLIPETIAYASLAGLPANMGLYTAIVAFLIYALTAPSGQPVVAPVSVVSLMVAVTKPALEVMRRSGFYDFLGPENFYHALQRLLQPCETETGKAHQEHPLKRKPLILTMRTDPFGSAIPCCRLLDVDQLCDADPRSLEEEMGCHESDA